MERTLPNNKFLLGKLCSKMISMQVDINIKKLTIDLQRSINDRRHKGENLTRCVGVIHHKRPIELLFEQDTD